MSRVQRTQGGLRMRRRPTDLLFLVTLAAAISSCSGVRPTTFVHPEYNFGYVERVAVIPFENLTQDQAAGARVTRYFITRLLATEAFDVVEPGEVSRALQQVGTLRTADLTQEQIKEIGRQLEVQGLFFGSVGESSTLRSGTANVSVVTLTARLVETDLGVTVWSATHTEGGRGFWSTLLGTGVRPSSEVTRDCVDRVIETLVE
ncbi:MAG: hypothetical protein GF355_11990 [Candidatus Eisenbacteria bacterium]|nr:hypothetical protein [Candidatus Eisenbacteria bacterium]